MKRATEVRKLIGRRNEWLIVSVLLPAIMLITWPGGPVSADIPRPAAIVEAVTETGLEGPPDDALIPPDLPGADTPLALAASQSSTTPGFYQTSEYMIGRVAIGLVLLESDGCLDPSTEDWRADEIALVRAKIAAAAGWWAAREPAAQLSFVFDERLSAPIAVPYEPITRPRSDQKLWIGAAMTALGYAGDDDSYFIRVRRYVNDLRALYQADWAFAIFVVDDANDADKAFADGFSAYAYLGGPFMVLTLNNGGYGVGHLDGVAAHEMGHIFLAVDQYAAAAVPCTLRAGYLGIENQNSQASCLSNQPSIMRSIVEPFANGRVDPYARGQVGWWDGDRNGVLDPLDTPVELDWAAFSMSDIKEVYAGKVKILPFPSFRRQPVTINRIVEVLYRLDDGTWTPTRAQDGAFDGTKEGFELEIPALSEGIYILDLLVRTWPGGERLIHPADVVVVRAPERTTPLQRVWQMQVMGNTLTVTGWAAARYGTVADVRFQIDDGVWQSATPTDGAFDAAVEAFALSASASNAGLHTLRLQTVDSDGRFILSEQNFQIETRHTVYLPLVIKSP